MAERPSTQNVIVIGAGVTGLYAALHLLKAGYHVTVIAKTLPPAPGKDVVPDEAAEYASFWAGAHWRTHAKEGDVRQQSWDLETYAAWMKNVEEERRRDADGIMTEEERSGIDIRQSTISWSSPQHPELAPSGEASSLWWSKHVRDFHTLSPGTARFTALAVNVPRHLSYIHAQILDQPNAKIIQSDLPFSSGLTITLTKALSLASLTPQTCKAIVNATGLSAKHLFTISDPTEASRLHPIRGQTVLVKGELKEIRTLQSYDASSKTTGIAYAIPRPGSGTTVLGGCNIKDEWSTEVDDEMTKEILRKCRDLVPELLVKETDQFEVVKVQVGLRPGRTGGARVEREVISVEDGAEGKDLVVVHAYGMAGAGFQNSVGVAGDVLKLVEGESLQRKSKL